MDALSDSTVTKDASTSMVSPSDMLTSITGTSFMLSRGGTNTVSLREPPDFFFGSGLLSLGSGFSSELDSLSAFASGSSPAFLAAAPASIIATTSPSFTLSFIFTESLVILPASGDGKSMEALSVSTVSIEFSASIESPTLTRISIISTSSAPPRSGTLISCSLMTVTLAVRRVRFVTIDTVLAHGFKNLFLLDLAIFRQGRQSSNRYVITIHLEEASQLLASIAATKTICTQCQECFGDKRPQLFGVQLDVVCRRDDRAYLVFQALSDMGLADFVIRVQQVPAFHVLTITGKLVKAGHTPDIRGNTPVVFQHLSSGPHFIENGACTQ